MIIVEASFRMKPGTFEQAKPHFEAAMKGSQAEEGCELFNFAQDIRDPLVIRLVERWRDKDALGAHVKTPHFKAWRAASKELGFSDNVLNVYEATPAKL